MTCIRRPRLAPPNPRTFKNRVEDWAALNASSVRGIGSPLSPPHFVSCCLLTEGEESERGDVGDEGELETDEEDAEDEEEEEPVCESAGVDRNEEVEDVGDDDWEDEEVDDRRWVRYGWKAAE